MELAAAFLGSVASKIGADSQSTEARVQVLQATTLHFTTAFLSKRDIHTLTATFDADVRKAVLTSYFLAVSALEAHVPGQVPRAPQSALLSAAASGEAEIYALFGGQGTNEVYFDELKSLYEIYKPYVHAFVAQMTCDILIPLAVKADSQNLPYFTYGLDVLSWLDGTVPVPPLEYLASVPVSFPVIGLTQLVQYLIVCRVSALSPGELRDRIKGTTGHSQGIVPAVVAATSTDLASFTKNSAKALQWLVWVGARGQEAFPVLAVEPNIVQDSVEGGEGVPSPMLSVTGLPIAALEKHLAGVNKHLPKNSQLGVSLYNGTRAFVVTGPPRALYGLVTALRKVRAPSGLDQSKVPFSQRKAVFNVRFLVVGVPYHSHYLDGATEKVMSDLGEELWDAKELGIAVYHTESGKYYFISFRFRI